MRLAATIHKITCYFLVRDFVPKWKIEMCILIPVFSDVDCCQEFAAIDIRRIIFGNRAFIFGLTVHYFRHGLHQGVGSCDRLPMLRLKHGAFEYSTVLLASAY
jgi:hypothetical protein